MSEILPNNKNRQWNQNNRSDILGTMWASFNLNLTEQIGKIKVSPRMVITTNTLPACPCAFKSAFGNLYSILTGGVYCTTGGLLETAASLLSGVNIPTTDISSDYSDMEVFNGQLVVSGQYGAIYAALSTSLSTGWNNPVNWAKLGDATTQYTVSNPSGTIYKFLFSGTGTDPNISSANVPVGAQVIIPSNALGITTYPAYTTVAVGADYFEINVTTGSPTTGSMTGLITTNLANPTGGQKGQGAEGLGQQTFHKLLNFPPQTRLYVADTNNQVDSCDTTYTFATSGNSYTFKLPNPELIITTMVTDGQYIFIFTLNPYGGTASVYVWAGVSANVADYTVQLDSRGILAAITLDGTVYAIDVNSRLLYWNGKTFIPVRGGYNQLPVKLLKYLYVNSNYNSANRWIHPNGITSVNDRINILINNLNNDNAGTIQEALPSGIWEFDASMGWYHKNAMTQYVIGGSGITDYGQNRISRVGALANLKPFDSSSNAIIGTIIAGATYYITNATTTSGIFTNDSLDTIQKRGYLVTVKMLSENLQDSFTEFWTRIRPLLNSTDRIYFKYRNTDDVATEVAITWINNNSFTTTGAVGSYVQGNEVEILDGAGSGWTPNIQSITNNAGTYTVVLDETFNGTLSGSSQARFQTWLRTPTPFSTQKKNLANFTISNGTSAWVQGKICFLFTGNNEMVNSLLVNSPYQQK